MTTHGKRRHDGRYAADPAAPRNRSRQAWPAPVPRSLLWIFLVLISVTGACAGEQASARGQATELERAWRQGFESARMGEEGFWLGYGIELPLEPGSLLIQGLPLSWMEGSIEFQGTYLGELTGEGSPGRGQLSIPPGEKDGEKVLRRVVLLFGFDSDRKLERVVMANRELPVELGERSFHWLGESSPEQSFSLLRNLFLDGWEIPVRRRLLQAVGWHQSPSAAEFLRQSLSDPNQDLRLEAVRGLRHFGDPATARLLGDLARRGDDLRLRSEAATVLSRIPGVTPILLGLLDAGDDLRVQSVVVKALARSGEGQATEAVVKIVESEEGSDQLRREAVKALARGGQPGRMEELLAAWALGSSSAAVRATAAEELGKRFLPASRAVLLKVVESEAESGVVREAIGALSRLPSAEAASTLAGLAQRDPKARVRMEAVRGLGKLRLPDLVPQLEKIALADSESSVQKSALEALRQIPGEEALEALIRLAETHPATELRRLAVQELARRAGEVVTGTVSRIARRDPERRVQSEAIEVLRKIGSEAAIQALVQIARDHPVYSLRRRAIQELGRSNSPLARAALLEMVPSRN